MNNAGKIILLGVLGIGAYSLINANSEGSTLFGGFSSSGSGQGGGDKENFSPAPNIVLNDNPFQNIPSQITPVNTPVSEQVFRSTGSGRVVSLGRTSSTDIDRFAVSSSGGAGTVINNQGKKQATTIVQDRYASQSVSKETAVFRSTIASAAKSAETKKEKKLKP